MVNQSCLDLVNRYSANNCVTLTAFCSHTKPGEPTVVVGHDESQGKNNGCSCMAPGPMTCRCYALLGHSLSHLPDTLVVTPWLTDEPLQNRHINSLNYKWLLNVSNKHHDSVQFCCHFPIAIYAVDHCHDPPPTHRNRRLKWPVCRSLSWRWHTFRKWPQREAVDVDG